MHTYNNLNRREFIKKSLLTVSTLTLLPNILSTSCSKKTKITGSIINDNSKIGHLIRENLDTKIQQTIEIPLIIIGSGVSGLSAAHYLDKHKIHDFLIFDLANKVGGNAISDKNNISSYPWAAHYLPIVNNTNTELIDFLHQQNVITDFDTEGLPIYNEYYLCFDPEDRLFINGHWQDGLIPEFGVPQKEKEEITQFFKLVQNYKHSLGSDGKPMFEIPIKQSSSDIEFRELDKISFADFLNSKNFTSTHLLWYLNYCCKDDYGSTLNDTSAYAGLHYLCSRKAKAANCDSSAVLTWPEGNAFLVNKLKEPFNNKIKINQLVKSVSVSENKVEILVYDTLTLTSIKYQCNQIILSTPQFVNQHILSQNLLSKRVSKNLFEYTPWMVANITLKSLPQYKGEPLCWDNVIYNSKSLGYINACHQHLNKPYDGLVLTYYLPLVDKQTKLARKQAQETSYETWVQLIINDLKGAHKNIEEYITNIDVKLWGHGMIKPKPNFIFNPEKEFYAEAIDDKIFFAHTDLSGISIFEEGFSQGIEVAKKIVALNV